MAFIGYFLAAGEAEVAVVCALMFHCNLRTGDFYLIETQHIVFSRCGNRASLSLPITKSLNKRLGGCETVEVYDPGIVARLASLVKDKLPGDKLFGMSMSFFRIMLLRAASFFGLHDLQIQAYSLRRGGATHFFRMSGSLDRTVLRGRWLSAKSARTYCRLSCACESFQKDGRQKVLTSAEPGRDAWKPSWLYVFIASLRACFPQ